MGSTDVVGWIRVEGPATESEVKQHFAPLGSSRNMISSFLKRCAERGELKRAVTVEEHGPVWLYYEDESQLFEKNGKRAWLPLFRKSEVVYGKVKEAVEGFAKSGVYLPQSPAYLSLDSIAGKVGMKVEDIENEARDLLKDYGFEWEKEGFKMNRL
jgi:hypothetical protein